MSYYDLMTYQTGMPAGKDNWLGNLRWFFQETEIRHTYLFSVIPSVLEQGQQLRGVPGASYDLKRILFQLQFLTGREEDYIYGADYMQTPEYKISMPFSHYGAIIQTTAGICLDTSDFSGRRSGTIPRIELSETLESIIIHDDNYFIVVFHNGTVKRESFGYAILRKKEELIVSISFNVDPTKAVEDAKNGFEMKNDMLQASKDFWEAYLYSCPLHEEIDAYHYYNEFLNQEEIYKPEDIKTRQLWHYWCVLMNMNEVEFNKFPLFISPDKSTWRGTWSNDGPESLAILSMTNQKELAKRCIVSYISAAINKDGIHAWFLHGEGTSCFGDQGNSGFYSHGVPNIIHTVDYYIRMTGDKDILTFPAGDGMTIYQKLRLYIARIHQDRDINHDHLIEWVNLWETGWDDKLGVFFEKASLEKWIEVVQTCDQEQIKRFYEGNSCPVTTIAEQVYLVWALRAFRNLANLMNDQDMAEYCSDMAEKVIKAVREKCWSEMDLFYYDIDVNAKTLCKNKNADAFYFLSFENDLARREALLSHLNDKNEFNLCYVPMASRDSKGFNPNGYWSGGHWPREMSYIAFGLIHCGYKDKAKELCIRAIMSEKGNVVAEVLNPLNGMKVTRPGKLAYGALNITALLELENRVKWDES